MSTLITRAPALTAREFIHLARCVADPLALHEMNVGIALSLTHRGFVEPGLGVTPRGAVALRFRKGKFDIMPKNPEPEISRAGRAAMRRIRSSDLPRLEINPGCAAKLERAGMIDCYDGPSPYKRSAGRTITWIRLTDAGRKILGAKS